MPQPPEGLRAAKSAGDLPGNLPGAGIGDAPVYERSTQGIPAAERLDYWREDVLRRMEPREVLTPERPFSARLRRISGRDAELVEHASDGLVADRTAARCARDGWDDIGIDLMIESSHAVLEQQTALKVRPGELHVVDYARPVRVVRSRHRAVGLIVSRARVQDLVGPDLTVLSGVRVPVQGLALLLASHVRTTLQALSSLSAAERGLAVNAATDMACAVLQAHAGTLDADRFAAGFYAAALQLIRRDCSDPSLTPTLVALHLGCSRAALYRAFARQGHSVAASIWAARLERAWAILHRSDHAHLLVSEVAYACGFLDHSTFDRMFKKRYGLSPRDARGQGQQMRAAQMDDL